MGESYQIAKENEKLWYLKIYVDGMLISSDAFSSRRKAQKELIAVLKFRSNLLHVINEPNTETLEEITGTSF